MFKVTVTRISSTRTQVQVEAELYKNNLEHPVNSNNCYYFRESWLVINALSEAGLAIEVARTVATLSDRIAKNMELSIQ